MNPFHPALPPALFGAGSHISIVSDSNRLCTALSFISQLVAEKSGKVDFENYFKAKVKVNPESGSRVGFHSQSKFSKKIIFFKIQNWKVIQRSDTIEKESI